MAADRHQCLPHPRHSPRHAVQQHRHGFRLLRNADLRNAVANPGGDAGKFGNATNPITKPFYHTLGYANTNGGLAGTTEPWDFFPFNDRDFTNVGELMLVPGCPPGLFTKQFVENPPSSFLATPPLTTGPILTSNGPVAGTTSTPGVGLQGEGYSLFTSSSSPPAAPHTYPYLVDNFFYTAASPTQLNPTSGSDPQWPFTGGPTGAGWHKMLEFFEVPSPAIGAIGPVASGINYDWMRQDTRPGLLNLNMIVDEEVFLGLMGNAGLHTNTVNNLSSIPVPELQYQVVAPTLETGQPLDRDRWLSLVPSRRDTDRSERLTLPVQCD